MMRDDTIRYRMWYRQDGAFWSQQILVATPPKNAWCDEDAQEDWAVRVKIRCPTATTTAAAQEYPLLCLGSCAPSDMMDMHHDFVPFHSTCYACVFLARHIVLLSSQTAFACLLLSLLFSNFAATCCHRYFLHHFHHHHRAPISMIPFRSMLTTSNIKRSQLRTTWYLFHLAVEDPMSQKRGVIVVVYNLGGFPKHGNDWEKSRRLAQMLRSLPIRIDAFFVCFDDAMWSTVVEGFSFMVTRFLRVRFRPLSGSRQECYYKLMALGVPYFALPVTATNSMVSETHIKMLIEHRRKTHHENKQWDDEVSRLLRFSGKRSRDDDDVVASAQHDGMMTGGNDVSFGPYRCRL
mmetsp:Transcript_1523/g.3774  ORF Transcript_1523/g.3774 Transcript_1523/m.3774 type:complete len:349 (-) Transcript_1523:171-1217(-)